MICIGRQRGFSGEFWLRLRALHLERALAIHEEIKELEEQQSSAFVGSGLAGRNLLHDHHAEWGTLPSRLEPRRAAMLELNWGLR